MAKIFFLRIRDLIFVSVFFIGCSKKESPQGEYYNPHEVPVDSFNVIHSAATSETGQLQQHTQAEIPREHFKTASFEVVQKDDEIRREGRQAVKISPPLQSMLAQASAEATVEVIVTLRDTMRLPLLPDFDTGEDRESSETKRARAIDELKSKRRSSQSKMLEALRTNRSLDVKEQFWLVNSVTATIPVGSVRSLAESSEVVYIQPVMGGEEPPADVPRGGVRSPLPSPDPIDGRHGNPRPTTHGR